MLLPVQKCSRGIPTYDQIPIGIRQGFPKWGFIVRIQADPDLELKSVPRHMNPRHQSWNLDARIDALFMAES